METLLHIATQKKPLLPNARRQTTRQNAISINAYWRV